MSLASHRELPKVHPPLYPTTDKKWDVFVSHAHEDKEQIARPIAHLLADMGFRVWFDEWELEVGDSITQKISDGLKYSHFGLVILSKKFFEKKWPRDELSSILNLEIGSSLRVLPIFHQVTIDELRCLEPLLVDRFGLSSEVGLRELAAKVAQKLLSVSNLEQLTGMPDGFGGQWQGMSGNLRLDVSENQVTGLYDWYGEKWVGRISGKSSGNLLTFDWDWDISTANGSGFFVLHSNYTREPRYSYFLTGGWVLASDRTTLETAIKLEKDERRDINIEISSNKSLEGFNRWQFAYSNLEMQLKWRG